MTLQAPQLTQADTERFQSDRSAESRVEMAAKVAQQFAETKLNESERALAEDIFRSLLRDEEVRVREALSENLKTELDLPHDVALSLASDADSVAIAMLEVSQVLTDDDMIAIIGGKSALKQETIAQRASVSAEVAEALIDSGNDVAVTHLVKNEGAELNEQSLGRVVEEYADSAAVSSAVSERPNLPAAISARLISVVSEQLQANLVERLRLPDELVRTLIQQAQLKATMGLLQEGCKSEQEVDALLDQLEASGDLTQAVALKALSDGDIYFFEAAMARLANIPVENARQLIHENGRLGLQSLLEKVAE